jgi:hypothetical protein
MKTQAYLYEQDDALKVPPSDMAVGITIFAAIATGKLSADELKSLYCDMLDADPGAPA